MKLHYMGKYDLDPAGLPHGEHKPGAVPFREVENTKQMSLIANGMCLVLMILLGLWRQCGADPFCGMPAGS